MFLLIASQDPSARFDFSQRGPRNYEEPPNSYYLFCAIDDLIWYGYFGFCVYLLKNIRYVKSFGRAINRSIQTQNLSDQFENSRLGRSHIRSKYSILETKTCPTGYEDLCCSLVCPCFTAAQMLRHTTDYDEYPAKCWSETGLPPHVPSIV
jgi:hypothetical protein